MDTANYFDWMFIIFIHEANGLTDKWNDIVTAIEKAGPGTNNGIFLIRDSLTITPSPNGTATNTFNMSISQLQPDAKYGYCFKHLPVVFDANSRVAWKKAFEYLFTNFRSKRKILSCLSHGAAFGIDVDHVPGNAQKLEIVRNPYYFLDKKDIDGIVSSRHWAPADERKKQFVLDGRIPKENGANVCQSLEILWMSDLADVLRDFLKGDRIDLLVLNNCYVQSFDTGFVLKDNVDYIVAPEGAMNAVAFDFLSLLAHISAPASAGIPGAELARNVIKDYIAFNQTTELEYFLDRQAVFANDVSRYSVVMSLLGEMLDILEAAAAASPGIIGILMDIQDNQVAYVSSPEGFYTDNYLDMIDAFQWVEMVMTRLDSLFRSTSLAARFADVKKNLVLAGKVGDQLLYDDGCSKLKYGYSGVSIFFPACADIKDLEILPWCAYFGDQIPSQWQARWKSFLNKYYKSCKTTPL